MSTPIKYGKLVRDRIPEIIKDDGWRPKWERIAQLEHAMGAKLIEEAGEFLAAVAVGSDPVGELVDVFEVVVTLAERHGVSLQQLIGLSNAKREKRGGFKDGVWLVEIDK